MRALDSRRFSWVDDDDDDISTNDYSIVYQIYWLNTMNLNINAILIFGKYLKFTVFHSSSKFLFYFRQYRIIINNKTRSWNRLNFNLQSRNHLKVRS